MFFVKEGVSQTNCVNKFSTYLGYERRNYSVASTRYDTTIHYVEKAFELKASIFYASFLESEISWMLFGRGSILISQKIHIIPLLTEKQETRLGMYIPFALCIIYYSSYKGRTPSSIHYDGFRFGLGTSFNLSKKWGVYGEYYIHPSKLSSYKPYLQFGVSYSWHTKKQK